MEHRFFRYGSLAVIGLLVLHVLIIRGQPEEKQNENAVLMILELFVIAILGGILFVTWVLPTLGEKVTEAVLSSGEKEAETPHSVVVALLAEGDYEGAIAELQKQAQAAPTDRKPVMEMARIYHDRLEDPDSAVQTIKTALVSREWSPEDETQLRLKLAEWLAGRKDFAGARHQLETVIEKYPGTPQAGAATSTLREVEEKEYLANRDR